MSKKTEKRLPWLRGSFQKKKKVTQAICRGNSIVLGQVVKSSGVSKRATTGLKPRLMTGICLTTWGKSNEKSF